MSASLSNTSALALVVQPVLADPKSSVGDVDRLAAELRALVLQAYPQPEEVQGEPTDVPYRNGTELTTVGLERPSLEIDLLRKGNEFRLYAGREFREARFGLPAGQEQSAVTCAEIVRQFSRSLADLDAPLAYLHYPHDWQDHGEADTEWLRIAYAVDRTTLKKAGAELAAYDTAIAHDVPLYVYDPDSGGGRLGERFSLLVDRPVTALPDEMQARSRVGLCIEGDANTGLVAEMLRGLPDVRIYGCTMSVLYGHTVCNLVVDAENAARMTGRRRLPGTLRVNEPTAPSMAPVLQRKDDQLTPFWVAWSCGEDVGVVARVLGVVYDEFERVGAAPPNVHYAITRVLADGFTSAGKVKFFGDRVACERLGLDGRLGGEAMTRLISEALGSRLLNWRPPNRAWRQRPVVVSAVEPSEEPWASLVAPEGALVALVPGD